MGVDYVLFCDAVDVLETYSKRQTAQGVMPCDTAVEANAVFRGQNTGGFARARQGSSDAQPGRSPTRNDQPRLRPNSSIGHPVGMGWEGVLEKMKHTALRHRIRTHEFFIDFDRH